MSKIFIIIIFICFSFLSFSDNPKCHVRLKIMDQKMNPIYPDSNISNDPAFNLWMQQNKVKKITKVFSSEYDSVGELRYKYKLFHDTNAYVIQAALDSMEGIKEVYIPCDVFLLTTNDEITISNYKIYPNPANETVNIELPKGKNGDYVLEVYDMQGKLIEKIAISESTELNTTKYPSGFYLFKLYNEQSYEMDTHKISINH